MKDKWHEIFTGNFLATPTIKAEGGLWTLTVTESAPEWN